MFGALFDAGVAGIGADDVLVTVQQFVDLGDIRHVGCRAYHAVYQPRLIIHADVRLHAKVILVPFLALVHFRVALAVLVLGRAGRVDQCGIDDSALAQRQAAIPQVAIDYAEDAGCQLMFLQQATEVEDGGFVGNALQAQPGELTQDGRLVECFFHGRVAVAEPVLHQMDT